MRIGYFFILAFLFGSIFGSQGIAQIKSQTNQQTNQKNVVFKSDPLKLRLNNEEAGTTDDTSVLTKRLKEVFKLRQDEGIFRKGTNEIETTVHLAADRSVSAQEMAKLSGVLNSFGAYPILIPVEIKNAIPKPNPLTLYVYAGSEESRPFNAGIEIGFIGQLSENNNGFPPDKSAVAVVVDKNGSFSLDGKRISASGLKNELNKRLKTKAKNKRIIFVQAENFGNMEDIAAIAASAGAVKMNVLTKNIQHIEGDISFSISPTYFKVKVPEQTPDQQSFIFYGLNSDSFSIMIGDVSFDKKQAEQEIKDEYEYRKKSSKGSDVSLTEIDGSTGVLMTSRDKGRYIAIWSGYRAKNGKQQGLLITFNRGDSNYSKYEFLQIIKSIKFN